MKQSRTLEADPLHSDSHMNQLVTYISAIKTGIPDRLISERQIKEDNLLDDGIVTTCREQTISFVNGVTIRQSMEIDQDVGHHRAACPECWISYEVVSAPPGLDISPKRKVFANKCQEAFWLKINAIQQ